MIFNSCPSNLMESSWEQSGMVFMYLNMTFKYKSQLNASPVFDSFARINLLI